MLVLWLFPSANSRFSLLGCDLWNRTTRGYIYQLGSWDRPYTIITICYTKIQF